MTATAPQSIRDLYDLVNVPGKIMSGIVGDIAHSFGYHLSRNDLPGNDYSVVLPLDRQGDAGSASALDISLPPAQMITVTNRLLAAAKARDPRLKALREFCGTTNGTVTHNYDLSNGHEGFNEWDDSHLWHVHLSFYRAYANNLPALTPIAAVISGGTTPVEEFLMALTDDQQSEMFQVVHFLGAAFKDGTPKLKVTGEFGLALRGLRDNMASLATETDVADAIGKIDTLDVPALADKLAQHLGAEFVNQLIAALSDALSALKDKGATP